jgi:Zn-dependent membrane protease YugP
MIGMFDPLFWIITLPALAFGLWAQWRVQRTFNQHAQTIIRTKLTGVEIARRVLNFNGLHHVQVEPVDGFLSDHYDPSGQVLRLSREVYHGVSISAAGVAAHEAGHALQDASGYPALRFRSAIVPAVQVGSWIGPLVFMAGLLLAPVLGLALAWVGVMIFASTALFAVVTLPVEFDASARAKAALSAQGLLAPAELQGVNEVLSAAALTYLAGAAQAVSTLLYYVLLLTGMRGQEE